MDKVENQWREIARARAEKCELHEKPYAIIVEVGMLALIVTMLIIGFFAEGL